MVRHFFQVNRGKLGFLALIFAGSISIFLIAGLLAARTEVDRPIGETVGSGLAFAFFVFVLMALALLIDGTTDFRRSRAILAQTNWTEFFEKFPLDDTVIETGKLQFKQEAKHGIIEGFDTTAFVDLKQKALHFVFRGEDRIDGNPAHNYHCNCHVAVTDLQMDSIEAERVVLNYLEGLRGRGITPAFGGRK